MKNSWKKTAAFVLAFTLVAAPLTQTGEKSKLFSKTSITAYAADPTTLAADTTTWENGDYVVPEGGVTISGHITVNGTVNLTLPAGTTLTANTGITLSDDATLNVTGEGAMTVNGTNNSIDSTVAGTGTLVLTSGTLTAKGGNGGNSKFGSDNTTTNAGGVAINGSVTLTGGTLTVTGGNGGSGGAYADNNTLGNGGAAISGDVTMSGGTLVATGGSGGNVGDGFGSGDGFSKNNKGGAGGVAINGALSIDGGEMTVTIGTSGTVKGDYNSNSSGGAAGAGIGGTLNLGKDVTLYDELGAVLDDNNSSSREYTGDRKQIMHAVYEVIYAVTQITHTPAEAEGTVSMTYGDSSSPLQPGETSLGDVKGKTVTLNITPKTGYRVKSVTVEKPAATTTTLDNTITAWRDGTYAVPAGGLTYSDAITVAGDVTLVLTDGETLTLNKGIGLAEGATLTVQGEGTMVVNGTNNSTASTVAGTGTLVLTSGTLTAKGGNGQSLSNPDPETKGNAGGVAINGAVIVNGGILTATGGDGGSLNASTMPECNGGAGGAAISGAVTINSGTLAATGGNGGSITITNWGTDNRGGAGGAAIGGAVTINGGTLAATKGDNGTLTQKNGMENNVGAGSAGYSGTLTLGANVKLYEGTDNTGTVLDDNDSDSRAYSGEKKANMYAYGSDVVAGHDEESNPIEAEKQTDASWQFTMPDYSVKINIEYEEGADKTALNDVTIADFTYDGTEKTPVLKYGETTLLKDTDYELLTTEGDTASATNAGTYTIHVSGKGNYTGENIPLTWKINKAPLNVTAEAKSKTCGEDDPELTYTNGALFGSDAFTGALTRAVGEDAGTYAITQGTLSAGDNYNITFTGADFTIKKIPFTLTGASLTYNGDAQNLIAGDVPAGTKFSLTAPQAGLDFEAESTKLYGWMNALDNKASNASTPEERYYYDNAYQALDLYYTALYYKDESVAADLMSDAVSCAGEMAQYEVTPTDDVKEAIDYINTYIKGKTIDDAKARFATVEPDDWSETIKATNAGDYTVYYKGSGNYDDTVKSVTASIAKAPASPEAVTGLTAAFGKTLADVTLPDGWAWDAPETSVGDVGNNTFAATFTPTDTANYNNYSANLTVAVTAISATPTAVGTLNATYGDTLADVDLPTVEDGSGTWAWKDAAATPVGNAGEQTFKAVFTPSSPNYTAVEQDVTINVAKADPTPDAVTGLTAAFGKKLSDVTLPTGWTWDAPATSVGNVGNNPFAATYTPTDTDNYNTLKQNLTVNVVAVDKTSLNEAIAAANTYLATIQKTVYADPALALSSAITDANAISTNDNVTEAQVAQAITDVNNAVTTAKAAVKDIDDTKAAQAVTDKINALPAAEAIKSTDKEAIEAAREAYTKLTEAQSAKVTKATTDKLTAAEKAVADRIAADAVIEKINAIGTVALTDESKALIDAARTAYDALATDEQKALVSNYATLTAGEKKYSDLQIENAKTKIDVIGDIELTAESKSAIETARAAYNALTADQKANVANAKVLDYAEKLYDALEDKKTAEDEKAAAETAQATAEKAAADAKTAQNKAEEDAATAKTAQATAEKAAADAKTAQAKAEEDAAAAKTAQATAEKAAADAKTAQTKAEEDAATAKTAQATAEKNAEAAKAAQTKAEEDAAAAKTAQATAEKAAADAKTAQATAEKNAETAKAAQAKAEEDATTAKAAQAKAEADATTAKVAQTKAEEDAAAAKTAQATAEKNAEAANSKVSDLTEQLAAAVKQIEELESSGNVDEALKKQVAELKEQLDAAKTAQNEANEALAKAQDVAAAKIAAAEAAQEKAEEEATAAEKAQATAEQTAKEATEKAAAAEKAQATAEQTAKEATEKAAAAEKAQATAEQTAKEATEKAAAAEEAQAVANQSAADTAIEKINAIGTVNSTNYCENKIVRARAIYDSLTDEQKALVPADILAKLTAAEYEYDTLPQTGMSGLHKLFAGLASLMGIAGIGLVKKSRKEDEEE